MSAVAPADGSVASDSTKLKLCITGLQPSAGPQNIIFAKLRWGWVLFAETLDIYLLSFFTYIFAHVRQQ